MNSAAAEQSSEFIVKLQLLTVNSAAAEASSAFTVKLELLTVNAAAAEASSAFIVKHKLLTANAVAAEASSAFTVKLQLLTVNAAAAERRRSRAPLTHRNPGSPYITYQTDGLARRPQPRRTGVGGCILKSEQSSRNMF